MRFSLEVYWGGLPFPPPADHVLLALPTITRPSWLAPHGMVHSFIELHKPLWHNKVVIHKVFFFSPYQFVINKMKHVIYLVKRGAQEP